jgi:hypothetical protein
MACKGCEDGTKVFGPAAAWTGKSDQQANAVFIALTGPMDSSKLRYVRTSLIVESSSGGTLMKPAVRMTNDNLTYDAPLAIDCISGAGVQSVSGNGSSVGDMFADLSTTLNAKQLAQFGVLVYNNAPALAVEAGMVTLKIDFRAVA